ncbi:MAG: ATP-dependent Clp protease proteolytic subunit [Planctomycetes bacterium]|nr:ATP-dependent Clp protease proteolytic subunit [Planctomycetota bacterium]
MPTDANDSMDSARSDSKGEQSWMSRALMKSRTIVASRQVSDRMAQDLITRLLLLEQDDGKAPITVYINSPGGSADSGFAIYDTMKIVSCPIRTVVVGLCASAGVILFMGGDKGQKYATPYSRFLLHQPSTGIVGPASDLEITAREILRIREIYAEIIQKEMGVDKEKLLADANRDFWLGAQDAKKYGLVDKIIASRSELS